MAGSLCVRFVKLPLVKLLEAVVDCEALCLCLGVMLLCSCLNMFKPRVVVSGICLEYNWLVGVIEA